MQIWKVLDALLCHNQPLKCPYYYTEKLDLQGMLWYHGSKSQKEAETSLESCTRDSSSCCYVVREHKGSLYLSLYYKEMHYHLPITSAQHGYVLEDHYNPFRTLKELVSHHQKHSVYVEGGEFTLSICCHKGTVACV